MEKKRESRDMRRYYITGAAILLVLIVIGIVIGVNSCGKTGEENAAGSAIEQEAETETETEAPTLSPEEIAESKAQEEAEEHERLMEEEIASFGNLGMCSLEDGGYLNIREEAEVMKNATNRILEYLMDEGREVDLSKGKILLATVEGDVHDIGKSIVASTLKKAGFDVIDLGCEVPVEVILEEAKKHQVDIIGTSALLTSTLTEQKKLEKLLSDTGEKENFITMVGGAPCTARWAKKINADGYSEDAIEAVEVAAELISGKKKDK